MEKGYLLLLVGAIFATTLRIPLPAEITYWWTRVTFFGFIFISYGLRQIQGTDKELRYAQFFTMLSLLVRLGLPWIPGLMSLRSGLIMSLAFNLLFVFSFLAIFFWLFKSEYLWSPSSAKRLDWYIYSGVALVYLILNVMFTLPMVIPTLGLDIMLFLNVFQFVNLLYNIVLIGLLVKLYLAARNDTGLSRWN